ncbi:MAG: hypothetical protein ACVCEJ_07060 [Candidatus Izemoplasmataceae bacterium]
MTLNDNIDRTEFRQFSFVRSRIYGFGIILSIENNKANVLFDGEEILYDMKNEKLDLIPIKRLSNDQFEILSEMKTKYDAKRDNEDTYYKIGPLDISEKMTTENQVTNKVSLEQTFFSKVKSILEAERSSMSSHSYNLRTAVNEGPNNRDEWSSHMDLTMDYNRINSSLVDLQNKINEPYFGKIIYSSDKDLKVREMYISHGHFLFKPSRDVEIYDWRNRLAQLYYIKSNREKIKHYTYDIFLRRNFKIKNRILSAINDTYYRDWSNFKYSNEEELSQDINQESEPINDPFLLEVLKQRKESSIMTHIIKTIQSNQYKIMNENYKTNFSLQGVAGSGKSMIMLHRLSILLYRNKGINTSRFLIITPSKLFMKSINQLSAELGIAQIRQTEIENVYLDFLKDTFAVNQNTDVSKEVSSHLHFADHKFDMLLDKIRDIKTFLSSNIDNLDTDKNYTIPILVNQATEDTHNQITKLQFKVRLNQSEIEDAKNKIQLINYFKKGKNFYDLLKNNWSISLLQDNIESIKFSLKISKDFQRLPMDSINKHDYSENLQILHSILDDKNQIIKHLLISNFSQEFLLFLLENNYIKIKFKPSKKVNWSKKIKEIIVMDERELNALIVKNEKNNNDYLNQLEYYHEISNNIQKYDISIKDLSFEIFTDYADYNLNEKKLFRDEAMSLSYIVSQILTPKKYSEMHISIDECQDINRNEYATLTSIFKKSVFNIYGDKNQSIMKYNEVDDIHSLLPHQLTPKKFFLGENYRNTRQISDYVYLKTNIDFSGFGIEGPVVHEISSKNLDEILTSNYFDAIICKDKSYMSEYLHYIEVNNLYNIFEVKGLEFNKALVVTRNLNNNELYVALTRCLNQLTVCNS